MRHDSIVSRGLRTATAAALALAISALPLLLDQCAHACEAHPGSVATAPACHHRAATGARAGRAPLPCGHDHNGAAAAALENAAHTHRPLMLVALVPAEPASAAATRTLHRLDIESPPGTSIALKTQSPPLRI